MRTNADNECVATVRLNAGFMLMIALLATVAAGKTILYDTLDPDCFWHLRVAEQLQRDGVGPLVDHLSFSSIKTPWTPYSWLAELAMKAVWDAGGFRAAVLVSAVLSAAFVILLALCAAQLLGDVDANPLAVILATAFGMYFSLPYLSFRPVTFSIVLLALCTWLLLRDRRLGESTRSVWLIIPLTAVNTNIHFIALLASAWVATLLIGAIVERRSTRRYAAMLVMTIVACTATPMLPGMIRSIWHYQFADPMLGAGVVAEFQPVWSGPMGAVSVILLLGCLACAFFHRERIRAGETIWMLGSLLLLIRLGRFAPVFAPIASAIIAACLPSLGSTALSRKATVGAVATLICIGLVRLATAFPRSNMTLSAWINRNGADTPGYPCDAADFVASHVRPQSGKLLNEFSWGGYLAWRLGDHYQVLLDGRTQLYTPAFWRLMYLDKPGGVSASDLLKSCDADVAVLPTAHSRLRQTLVDQGWSSAYRDDRAEVLLPNRSSAHASTD
jgi:hypothetical protein